MNLRSWNESAYLLKYARTCSWRGNESDDSVNGKSGNRITAVGKFALKIENTI